MLEFGQGFLELGHHLARPVRQFLDFEAGLLQLIDCSHRTYRLVCGLYVYL